jgi:predicted TIM-barrel fold metal-dependent hydrolase
MTIFPPGLPTGFLSGDPIVDCHHHIWRLNDLPWLNGPIIPRIFGPYEAIQRDYLVTEYRADAEASGVSKSVYTQVNWPLERSVDEVRWVQGVADETGWPHAIVGSADMFDASCADVFAEQVESSPLLRGTRLQLHWHERELYRFAAGPNMMDDPMFRKNLGLLEQYGWVFELQVFGPQMADAARLVADFPQLTFVLVHAGMLEADDAETVALWEAGMAMLAAQPNVVVKLTGLGTFTRSVDVDHISQIVARCLDWFGADRCMWGSNFPVEKLWTDYATLVHAFGAALADADDRTRAAVFGGTAARVYRLG